MSRALPVPQDMAFQRRSWFVQRVGWLVILFLLCLAFLGVFSQGPLSRTTVSAPSGEFAVQYERLLRLGARDTMLLDVLDGNETTEVVLSPEFLEALSIESVHPLPATSSTGPDGLHMRFETPGRKGRVVMTVRPDAAGFADATVSVAGTEGIAPIPFFVFP